MKKLLTLATTTVMCTSLLTGCSSGGSTKDASYIAALLIPYQGDQSFYDLAATGINLVNEQVEGVTTKIKVEISAE